MDELRVADAITEIFRTVQTLQQILAQLGDGKSNRETRNPFRKTGRQ